MPRVTSVCPGWMATSPLKRCPSTNTGQIRSAPPAAERTTPNQRMASPSTVHALAGTEISAAEQRDTRQHEAHDHERDQRRVGEEGRKGAPAEDREPEIGQRPHHGDEC